jgi:Rps23 Pro-64 3,4-dihydroxylase Tpa1-like proline 4-hydroxylase
MTREDLTAMIVERLEQDLDALRQDFNTPKGAVPTRHTAIDNLLPEAIAREIYEAFPTLEEMRLMSSFREQKYTSKSFEKFNPLLLDISLAIQAPEVIATVEKITGVKDMVGDPHFYAGGLSAMAHGHYLNPHIDNSHDHERKHYRVLNLLYYITPDWKPENGGNLELWDNKVREVVEIPSLFNRLVLMETNEQSWHSVNEVKIEGKRCCVSNYYFSPHTPNNGRETFHITFFQARPEQPVRRLLSTADGYLRTFTRKFVKEGLSKKDLYETEKQK